MIGWAALCPFNPYLHAPLVRHVEPQDARMPRSLGKQSVPGRRRSPRQQAELERIWHALDNDGRKLPLYFARRLPGARIGVSGHTAGDV